MTGFTRDGKLQQRCMLAFTYLGSGRGGECKFQDTASWMYHPRFQFLDVLWTETKNLTKYSMPMVPNKWDWSYDIFHCLATYFMCEGGLIRGEQDEAYKTFLFPSLHAIKNNSVTKKLTNIIQAHLPDGVPEQLNSQYTAKSLRIAAVSVLMFHHGLNGLGDICGRTGHSTGTNLDSYGDDRNPLRGLRGGMALSGWDNVRARVTLPSFKCLTASRSTIESFIEEAFPGDLDAFKREGSLYGVSIACAASLVMFHETVTTEMGPANVISSKLNIVARRA